MTIRIKSLKSIALAGLIVLGLGLQHRPASAASTEVLTVAGGCFWCVESDFESVPGVHEVVSGYTGGTTKNPTYKQVTRGGSGHYEAVQIKYDPARVSVKTLLSMFFRSVDPTDDGGQFCDRGDSYRTAIWYRGAGEKRHAEMAKADAMKALGKTIVTPILPAVKFYPAEEYHQNYYKSQELRGITSVGIGITRAESYKRYRKGCGRDRRVKQIWGNAAPFVH